MVLSQNGLQSRGECTFRISGNLPAIEEDDTILDSVHGTDDHVMGRDFFFGDFDRVVGEIARLQPDKVLNVRLADNTLHDPRNYNLKKHMVRLAIYELTKLIAPNNVSTVRIRDYDDSMKWLSDASKLRLDPQISRKIGDDKKEVMDWQLATFQTNYDPWKNPWMT